MNGDNVLNKYSIFYLAMTIIWCIVVYHSSKLSTFILASILMIGKFIFFLTFFNADEEELEEGEKEGKEIANKIKEAVKGENSDKNDD